MTQTEITLTPTDAGTLAIASVRYTLSRQSYLPADICRLLRTLLPVLHQCDLYTLASELVTHLDSPAGEAAILAQWRGLLVDIQMELSQRECRDWVPTGKSCQ